MDKVSELGLALRGWRDRLDPGTVGLPHGGHRRAAGLRREELAMLAGLSVDYVTRLEQGRAQTPSAQVLAALARALQLSDAEREHLFLLAGQRPPAGDRMPGHVTPGVQRLLAQLDGTPVGVFDAAWTLLAWNELWAALNGDPGRLRGRDRNVLWRYFTGQSSRVRQTPEQRAAFEASAVADLRSATARYPADPRLRRLVSDLRAASDEFGRVWAERAVGTHESSRKTFTHPAAGELTLDCDVLTAPSSDLRIVAYTAAPGSEAASKLRLLAVVGTQELAEHR
jgi:transcriptional regulator with XRE-family HTH domain